MSQSFLLRELFHLQVVRQLAARLSGRAWAVKGGICLRLFHRSPRLSEDLDCDAATGIRSETLRRGVDQVLDGRGLAAALAAAGIASLDVTRPKQTETTQRWKVALRLAGGGSLATKIEFSRRKGVIAAVPGVPGPDILSVHACPPFAVPHYDAAAMAVQKVLALAAPGRNAVRDLFDLDHLLTHGGGSATDLLRTAGPGAADAAAKVAGYTLRQFEEQVLPYLTEELAAAYRRPGAFSDLQRRVRGVLVGAS